MFTSNSKEIANSPKWHEMFKNFRNNILKFFTRTINVLLISNPIAFWWWSMLFPKGMAKFLEGPFFFRTSLGRTLYKSDLWIAERLLPKGHLMKMMKVLRPFEFSVDAQERYFYFVTETHEEWELSDFTSEAQREIWRWYHQKEEIAKKLLAQGYSLREQDYLSLIHERRFNLIRESKKTLPLNAMKMLYYSIECNEPEAGKLFFELVARNGASEELVGIVKDQYQPKLIAALREFSQVAIVRTTKENHDTSLFFKLVKDENLCLRAQMILSLWQYDAFNTLCKHLDKEVILAKSNPYRNMDWKLWVEKFLLWEDLSFPEWEVFIMRNPEVRTYIMNLTSRKCRL